MVQAAHPLQFKFAFKDKSTLPPSLLVGKDLTTEAGLLLQLKNQVSTELTQNRRTRVLKQHFADAAFRFSPPRALQTLSCVVIPEMPHSFVHTQKNSEPVFPCKHPQSKADSYPPVPDTFKPVGSFLKDLQEFMSQFCRGDTKPSKRVKGAETSTDPSGQPPTY